LGKISEKPWGVNVIGQKLSWERKKPRKRVHEKKKEVIPNKYRRGDSKEG